MDVNKTVKGICSVGLATFLAFPTSSLPSVFADISGSGDSSAVGANSNENSGVSGSFDSKSGVLTISGTGKMEDFDDSTNIPTWNANAATITSIVIEDGVTSIGKNAFCKLTNVKTITIPSSVTEIGEEAFPPDLKDIYFNGTFEKFDSSLSTRIKSLTNAAVHCMIISSGEIGIDGVNKTSVYYVGDRPKFEAKVTDTMDTTAPRCTIEEKWVSTDGKKEITSENENKFEEGVVYNYVIVVKPNDKFSFKTGDNITINELTLSSEGVLTFKENFSALISIKSVSFSESENFDIPCKPVNEEPKFIKNVGTDANYSIVYELWEKLDSSGKVEKRAISGQYTTAGSEVDELESFEENSSYKYTICLKPKEGYGFDSKLTATLGGKAAEVAFKEDGSVVLTRENFGTKHSFPLTKNDRVEPTCTTAGTKEFYECPKCAKKFEDKDAQKDLTDVSLPLKDHKFVKVEAKKSTCSKKGNIEYFKCEECGTYFKSENGEPGEEITDKASVELAMISHTFDESVSVSDGENGHYHKCKYCGAHSETVAHTFDKEVEDKKYLKDGLTCGDVLSYYKSCECGESSKDTENEETFESKEGNKLEHEFGKDGVCTICQATDYKVSAVDGNTYYENENGSFVFRANGSLDKLLSVKVDGTVLTQGKDYTVKSGSTIVELKNDYLKTLGEGEHTLTIVYEDGQCETNFDVKAGNSTSNDDTKIDDNTGSKGDIISDIIYKTGDNAGLISLISTVLTSGLASVWFAKKRRKNR